MCNQDFVQLMDEIVVTPQAPTPPEHPLLTALRQLIAEQSPNNERLLHQIQEIVRQETEASANEQLDSREFKRAVESIAEDLLDPAVRDLEDKISDLEGEIDSKVLDAIDAYEFTDKINELEDKISDLEGEIDSKVSDAIDVYDFTDNIRKEVIEQLIEAENKANYGSVEFFDCYLEKHVTKLIDDKINFMLAALAQQLTSMVK